MNDNGDFPILQTDHDTPDHRQRLFMIKAELPPADVLRIVYIVAGTVITCVVVVCAYLAGVMIMALGIIGALVFMWMMMEAGK